MKILFPFLCLFALSSCLKDVNCLKGSGEIEERSIDLKPITGFHSAISADIYLTQGDTQSIEIHAQSNIIDQIKTTITDGIWHIDSKKCINTDKPIDIYITMPTLTEIKISGSGNTTSSNAFPSTAQLDLTISGSGNINIEASASETSTTISGSGNITLKGTGDELKTIISGSGDINTYDFPVNTADIDISGSGNCRTQVNNELSGNISGSGNIYYKGSPSTAVTITGSGDLIDKN